MKVLIIVFPFVSKIKQRKIKIKLFRISLVPYQVISKIKENILIISKKTH